MYNKKLESKFSLFLAQEKQRLPSKQAWFNYFLYFMEVFYLWES